MELVTTHLLSLAITGDINEIGVVGIRPTGTAGDVTKVGRSFPERKR